MAFNAGAIVAHLKLNSKQFTGAINTAQKRTKGFTKHLKGMSFATKALVGGSLIYATKKLGDFIGKGARLRDMEGAFNRLAAGSGHAADSIVSDVKAITKSLSRERIIESANMLELLGVGMENTARLTEIARAAGVALGKDTGFMLESIATGTARQSRLWLDNLGIIISVEEANENYARTLGKLSSQLTDTEKRAGFLHAVLSKGSEIVSKVSGDTELATEQTAAFSAAMKDFFNGMSRAVSGPGGQALGWMAKQMNWLADANERWSKAGGANKLNAWFGNEAGKAHLFDRSGAGMPTFMPGGSTSLTAGFTGSSTTPAQNFGGTGTAGGISPVSGVGMGTPYLPFDWGAQQIPELTNGLDEVEAKFMSIGSLAGGFFSTLATGAAAGGEAFKSALGSAIGSVASAMGQFLIYSGKGLGALMSLGPAGAIIAGAALMGLGALVKGALSSGFSGGGGPSVPSFGTPRAAAEVQDQRGLIIHIDNVNGSVDESFIKKIMRDANAYSRSNGYSEVFLHAS